MAYEPAKMRAATAGIAAGYENELKQNWFLLFTMLVGAAPASTLAFTTGVFTAPWEREFGWQRGQIGAALAFVNSALVFIPPLVGRVIDRYGVRRPTLAALAFFPLVFAALSQVGPQLWTLYAAYFAFGVVGAAAGFVAWTRAVNEYFERGRGLALGIGCNATTLAAFTTPLLANQLIRMHGWRMAWLGFALISALIWPIAYLGLKDVKKLAQSSTLPHPEAARGATGYRQLLRDRNLWLLACSFVLMTFVALGLVAQTVPFLSSQGFSSHDAISWGAGVAIGLGAARLVAGFFLDRVFAPTVFKALCFVGIAACAALLSGQRALMLLGVIATGALMGAEGDIMAYAVSRYLDLRNYAKAYGLIFGINALGSMSAPAINGYIYDLYGNYTNTMILAMVSLLAAAFVMHQMPRYPDRSHPAPAEHPRPPVGETS